MSFCWDCVFSGCITRCTFKSFRKLAHPVETLSGPYVDPSHLQHLVFFILTCLPSFISLVLCIQRLHHKMHFYILQEMAHPVETLRGPYEVAFLLKHLAFFYLDLLANFFFAGTVLSIAASQDALLLPPGSWHTL
jgi:hypothetical protein